MEIYQQLLHQNTSIQEQRSHEPPQPTNGIVQPAAPLPKPSSTARPSAAASSSASSTATPPGLQQPPSIQLPQQLPGAHFPTLTSTPASSSTPAVPPHPAALTPFQQASCIWMCQDVNESQEEAQQSASALLDNIILQSWYQDGLSSCAEEDIKQAMHNQFQQLQQQQHESLRSTKTTSLTNNVVAHRPPLVHL